MTSHKLGLAGLAITLGIALGAGLAGPPAFAESAPSGGVYVFWSYWDGAASGAWTYSNLGAQSDTPADGTATGWRYGAGQTPALTEKPRANPDFAGSCGATTASSGQKRVAVTIDYGTAEEAPGGSTPPSLVTKCAVVPKAANGLQVLTAVTSLRQATDGLVCGISNYPASGCGQQLEVAQLAGASKASGESAPGQSAPGEPATSASTGWIPFAVGALILLALIVLAVLLSRRRKRAEG